MGHNVVGIDCERLAVLGNCLTVVAPLHEEHSRVVQRDLVIRIYFQRPAQGSAGLVVTPETDQGEPSVHVDRRDLRTLIVRDTTRVEALLEPADLDQFATEVQVSIPSLRIQGHDVAEEGDRIVIDSRVAPSQPREQRQDDRRCTLQSSAELGRHLACTMDRDTNYNRDHADTGQVLVPIRYERKLHVPVVHESEHWCQGHCEVRDAD